MADLFHPSFQDIETLANDCFQTNRYLENYPQVFQKGREGNFCSVFHRRQLVSFCAHFPLSFFDKDSSRVLVGYGIGTVVTALHARGKGFAYDNVKRSVQRIFQKGADFAFLFATYDELYKRLGFCPVGYTHFLEFIRPWKCPVPFVGTMSLSYESSPSSLPLQTQIELWSFFIKHSAAGESVFSFIDWCDILKTKCMSLFILRDENMSLRAISFFGKGDDFNQVLHGLVFSSVDDALCLVEGVLKNPPCAYPLYLFLGPHEKLFPKEIWGDVAHHHLSGMYLQWNPDIPLDMQSKWGAMFAENQFFVRSLQGI